MTLKIRLLGGLQVCLQGRTLNEFPTDKTRALLAYLAMESGRPHRREALAGLLWAEQPEERARQSLRQALSSLRRLLGEGEGSTTWLEVERESVLFNPRGDAWVDAGEVVALWATCRSHSHRRLEACLSCLQRLERVAALYAGPLLAGLSVPDSDALEAWLLRRREWLQQEAFDALSAVGSAYERRGEIARARACARQCVELEPWREEAQRDLMRLLALEGQRSAALRQYQTCRRVLRDELAVEPTDETEGLAECIRTGTLRAHRPAGRLPARSGDLVGRDGELAELADILAQPGGRLVTVLGPGGVGKTRLALEVAERQVGLWPAGVFWASLSGVQTVEELAGIALESLGLTVEGAEQPAQRLLAYLAEREALLVLDECEHLSSGSDLLLELLRRCRQVTLLATSRERLALRGERVYHLEGLGRPEEGQTAETTPGALALFLRRAREVDRRFSCESVELEAAGRICRLVEGLPLAVELAAAWAPLRSCREIAAEVEGGLQVLAANVRGAGERQASVWAAFEPSWRRLGREEQRAFAGLAVFRGGFDGPAALAVAGAEQAVLERLTACSLLRHDGAGRFALHSLLRQYAEDKLSEDAGELERCERRHAAYYAELLARSGPALRDGRQVAALAEVSLELENARRAWVVTSARGWTDLLSTALDGLCEALSIRGRYRDALSLLELAAGAVEARGAAQADLAGRLLVWQGTMCLHMGMYGEARQRLRDGCRRLFRTRAVRPRVLAALGLGRTADFEGQARRAERLATLAAGWARACGDTWALACSLGFYGSLLKQAGRPQEAWAVLQEGVAVGRAAGDRRCLTVSLSALADMAADRGDYGRAEELYQECLELGRELGDRYREGVHLNNLGTVAHLAGDLDGAERLYLQSLSVCREIGDRSGEGLALSNLGETALARGALAEAEQYCAQALALGRAIGDQWAVASALNALGQIACARGDMAAARQGALEGLAVGRAADLPMMVCRALVTAAEVLLHEKKREPAAGLLTAVLGEPAAEEDVRRRARRLLEDAGAPAAPEDGPALGTAVDTALALLDS